MTKLSRRVIQRYPEACRFAGIWYWQTGRRRKVVRWWTKGLEWAGKQKQTPEIGGIYREIGRGVHLLLSLGSLLL